MVYNTSMHHNYFVEISPYIGTNPSTLQKRVAFFPNLLSVVKHVAKENQKIWKELLQTGRGNEIAIIIHSALQV